METTKVKWLTKEEAAQRLGDPGIPMSTRRVLELAAEGKLKSTRARDPRSGQRVVYIDAGSVERYIDERHVPKIGSTESEAGKNASRTLANPARSIDLVALAALLHDPCGLHDSASRTLASPAPLWLTLVRGRWRVKRTDLDNLAGIRHAAPGPKKMLPHAG
jgi:hypothetical protein